MSEIQKALLAKIDKKTLPFSIENSLTPKERQKLLATLARKAASLSDTDWAEIGQTAQDWVSDAMDSIKNGDDIIDFSDVSEEAVQDPKPAVASFVPKESTKSREGTSDYFRKCILENPKKSRKDLVKQVEAAGYPIKNGTAVTIYYETHATLRLMYKMGVIQEV